jgi:hypothetical protein
MSLLRGNHKVTADAGGRRASVRHIAATVKRNAVTCLGARGCAIQTLGISRRGNGLHTKDRFIDIFYDFILQLRNLRNFVLFYYKQYLYLK